LIVSALLVRHTSLHPVCARGLRCGSSAAARTHVQSRHATTRGGIK